MIITVNSPWCLQADEQAAAAPSQHDQPAPKPIRKEAAKQQASAAVSDGSALPNQTVPNKQAEPGARETPPRIVSGEYEVGFTWLGCRSVQHACTCITLLH
jgi:hypothetical protein